MHGATPRRLCVGCAEAVLGHCEGYAEAELRICTYLSIYLSITNGQPVDLRKFPRSWLESSIPTTLLLSRGSRGFTFNKSWLNQRFLLPPPCTLLHHCDSPARALLKPCYSPAPALLQLLVHSLILNGGRRTARRRFEFKNLYLQTLRLNFYF